MKSNIIQLRRKLNEVYTVEPNDLGFPYLTSLYRRINIFLKRMPFIIIVPASLLGALLLSVFLAIWLSVWPQCFNMDFKALFVETVTAHLLIIRRPYCSYFTRIKPWEILRSMETCLKRSSSFLLLCYIFAFIFTTWVNMVGWSSLYGICFTFYSHSHVLL